MTLVIQITFDIPGGPWTPGSPGGPGGPGGPGCPYAEERPVRNEIEENVVMFIIIYAESVLTPAPNSANGRV